MKKPRSPGPLFDDDDDDEGYNPPYARRDDPETSHQAAAAMRGKKAELNYKRIAAFLEERPQGATSLEVSDGTGILHVTSSSAMRPASKKGLAVLTTEARVGWKGVSGQVWKAPRHAEHVTRCTGKMKRGRCGILFERWMPFAKECKRCHKRRTG